MRNSPHACTHCYRIRCDPGHAPSTPVVLRCEASTSQWDQTPPSCEGCLTMHYRVGSQCRPCSNSTCNPGRYRSNCTLESDSSCRPCPVPNPLHSSWLDECRWTCDVGYSQRNDECRPIPAPRLVLKEPIASLSESASSAVNIFVQISRKPAAPVKVSVRNFDGQVIIVSGDGIPDFTPGDWLRFRNVSVLAFDDYNVEGYHSGILSFALSSSDAVWNDVTLNVSIPIADNDCHGPKYPQNGRILSCGRTYGDLCIFQCDVGFFPEGNVTSRCLEGGTWSTEAPTCDTCASTFYRDGPLCHPCSTGECHVGFYRSACSDDSDSVCLPCSASSKPQHSRFVSAGEPEFADACRWACEIGFFESSLACVACSTSACAQPGFYRESCTQLGAKKDAECVPCNNTLPQNAAWRVSETNMSACGWICKRGFREEAGLCVADDRPFIRVQGPDPTSVREGDPFPAKVWLKLSEAPIANVTISLNHSEQIWTSSTLRRLIFTPEHWNVSQMILVAAVDDGLFEGEHMALIFVETVSADTFYDGIVTAPISVGVIDNDCPNLEPPADGSLISCNNTHGQTCTITCDLGLDPTEPVVLLCLESSSWNSSIPRCTKCADKYYLSSSGECTKCSTTPCTLIGYYRPPCSSAKDSTCQPCTQKPLNSHFISSAEPFDLDSCPWSCDADFYETLGSCKACTTAPCDVGMYRGPCGEVSDSVCSPCQNVLPANSHFVSHGGLSGYCDWHCDDGFEPSPNASACVPLPGPVLLITPIRMHTTEDINSLPATFNISLSPDRPPKGAVTAVISPQAQLQSCWWSPEILGSRGPLFTPENYGTVTVSCRAVEDNTPEGLHSGTVIIRLESAADPGYASLSPASVEFDIAEIKCPQRNDGQNYQVIECNRTVGGLCYFGCNSGYDPQSKFVLQCVKDSTGIPVWSGQEPTCLECLPGYYKKGSQCLECIWSCAIGQYRWSCASESGAVCVECTNEIPLNAEYTSSGNYSNDCAWSCKSGFFYHIQSSSCIADIQPSLIVSQASLIISEEPGSTAAVFSVWLSIPPVSPVSVELVWDRLQLHPPTPTELTFTPDSWALPLNVSITAIYDKVDEAPEHQSWLQLRPPAPKDSAEYSVRSIGATLEKRSRRRAGTVSQTARNSVSLCHRTSSSKNPWKVIEVNENAVPAHLEHGDVYPIDGTCPDMRFLNIRQNVSVTVLDYGCPSLSRPRNGNISCLTETAANKTCTVSCNAGYTIEGADTMNCDKVETTWNRDTPSCIACAEGKYRALTGGSTCTTCPANANSPAASHEQEDCSCNIGYSGPNGGDCVACTQGKYKNVTGDEACVSCAAFSDAPAGSDAITDCLCVSGYTGPDGGGCTPCEAGKFKPSAGSASCSNTCPANSISDPASDDISDCKCNAGYTGNDGGLCNACPAGKFKPNVGDENCTACPAHSDSSVVASEAISDCQCQKGYSGPDGGTCEPCEPGTYKAITGAAACVKCVGGKFSSAVAATGGSTCLECPAGSTSPLGSSGVTSCECDPGWSGDAGGPCGMCESGEFKEASGDAPCVPCPQGYTSPPGSTSSSSCIEQCSAGSFGPDGGPCELCPAGKYKPDA